MLHLCWQLHRPRNQARPKNIAGSADEDDSIGSLEYVVGDILREKSLLIILDSCFLVIWIDEKSEDKVEGNAAESEEEDGQT
jgi:hypothetical protein